MEMVAWWKARLVQKLEEFEEAKEILFGSIVDKLKAILRRTDLAHQIALLERNIARKEAEVLTHQLRNLLAVIHRDGGHYTEEHGLEVAVEEAMEVVSRERAALDEERYRCLHWAHEAVEIITAVGVSKDAVLIAEDARKRIESGTPVAEHQALRAVPLNKDLSVVARIATHDTVASALRTPQPERVPSLGLVCNLECHELMARASGDALCDECNEPYRTHPYCRGQITMMTGEPGYFVHVSCDGRHLKL